MISVGGENLIDFIQLEHELGNPVYQANPGGSPYNCAKAIGGQGVPVCYLTPISTDSLGQLLATGLTDAGVTLCGERRCEPTSLAVVSLSNAAASYQFYRQNTAERMVTLESLKQAFPANSSAFHLGSLTIAEGADADVWADFYVAMAGQGQFTSLDPNIRASFISDRATYLTRLDRLLAATDLLKLSDEDLAWLVPDTDIDNAARQLAQRSSAQLVVVTLGAQGAFALFAGNKITVGAAPVRQMKDTVGAGDTFMATLLAGLQQAGRLGGGGGGGGLARMSQSEVADLLARAATAAALNCEKSGCNPPSLAELNGAVDKAVSTKET